MNFLRPLIMGFILTLFASISFAWPMVADTWNTNQLYAGSVYIPSSQYSGWTYNAYMPNSGYPVMGGGRYYPYGYNAGSYAPAMAYGYPSYDYPSYGYDSGYGYGYGYGAPVHTTSDYYNRGFSLYYSTPNYTIGCTIYGC